MWLLAFLTPFFGTLPSWSHLPLSGLVGLSLLSGLIAGLTQLSGWNLKRKLKECGKIESTNDSSRSMIECLNSSKPTDYLTGIDIRKVVALILIAMCSSLLLAWAASRESGVYEYTKEKDGCCKITDKIDDYTFMMEKKDGPFKAPFCPDYNIPGLKIQPGYLLKKFRYKDMGECWSIERSDLGIWFERDPKTHLAIRFN